MKKKLAILFCMIASILMLVGCGAAKEECPFTEETIQNYSLEVLHNVTELNNTGKSGVNWDAEALSENYYFDYYVQKAATENYAKAMKEMGSIDGENFTYNINLDADEIIAKIHVNGVKHDAEVEVIFTVVKPNSLKVKSFAVNPSYTFGEKMGKAGMNTLLGMGSVFCVLIIIIFVISLFSFLPKLTQKKDKKAEKKDSVDNTIAQIIENEENLVDDLELVAVIAAAIAAYEGTSADGFVVRSINKRKRA